MPGDAVYDAAVFVPADLLSGEYQIGVALLDPNTREPKVKLAIAGVGSDGWYDLGSINVQP